MSMEPIGGKFITKTTVVCGLLVVILAAIIVIRLFTGLGLVTNLNDGYPWGLWIAYDVVAGTAVACGGYSMALLVYVLNRGRYHPLVRPAVLASMFGYSLGGFSVIMDIGRWWNFWHILWPSYFNTNSVMLEVALCISCYTTVLIIEFAPAFVEKAVNWTRARAGLKYLAADAIRRGLERVLFVFIALGVLLPTMHQSSLGTMLVPFGDWVHPLWQTPLLPALYIISAVALGFGVVTFEAVLVPNVFRRPAETRLLSFVLRNMAWVIAFYLTLRWSDLIIRDRLGLVLSSGGLSVAFLVENVLFILPILITVSKTNRLRPRFQFIAGVSMMAAAILYRIDAYLIAYDHPGWHYFPSVPEILLTVGLIAVEVLGYNLLVKFLPVLHRAKPVGPAAAATKA